MGESGVPTSRADQHMQVPAGQPGALCSCGCGGMATKASNYRWAYVHDPAIPDAQRLAERQLGGRRGAMTPAEISRLLDGADLDTREGRQHLRDRFLRLRLAGRIGGGIYQDLLRAVDGAAKDHDRTPAKASPHNIVVEVARYGGNGHPEPA